ncbi:MAG: helix-turn-helix transcriptional regulator [Bacteroidales bacterium]|nr:helix-turn-helix transcriptional regulator [Bacteroidales bacterium]
MRWIGYILGIIATVLIFMRCSEAQPKRDINAVHQFKEAINLINEGKLSACDSIGESLIAKGRKDKDSLTTAYGFLTLGLYYEGEPLPMRRASAEKALELSAFTPDATLKARCHNILAGYSFLDQFDVPAAISHLLKAKNYALQSGDSILTTVIETNISEIYSGLGDTLGLRYSRDILIKAHRSNNIRQTIAATKHLVLTLLSDSTTATQAKPYINQLADVDTGYIYHYLQSYFYLAVDSLPQASASINASLRDSINAPEAILAEAMLLNRRRKWRESNQKLQLIPALSHFPETDIRAITYLSLMADNCSQLGQLDSANLLLREVISKQNELEKVRKSVNLNELRTQYDVEKKEDEIRLHQAKIRTNTWIFSLLIISLILGFIGYVIYTRRQNQLLSIIINKQKDYARLSANTTLSEKGESDVSSSSSSAMSDSTLTQIWEKISNEIANKIYLDPSLTRDSMASRIGCSHTWVTEAIRVKTGKSFPQFIGSLRIAYACQLMESADKEMTIDEISSRSGFTSRATFHKVFREMMGVTPARFRQRCSLSQESR